MARGDLGVDMPMKRYRVIRHYGRWAIMDTHTQQIGDSATGDVGRRLMEQRVDRANKRAEEIAKREGAVK